MLLIFLYIVLQMLVVWHFETLLPSSGLPAYSIILKTNESGCDVQTFRQTFKKSVLLSLPRLFVAGSKHLN